MKTTRLRINNTILQAFIILINSSINAHKINKINDENLINSNQSFISLNYNSINVNKTSKSICSLIPSPNNYSTEYIDKLMYYKHFISGWLTLFIIFAGIIANSVTICALLHGYMRKSSTNAYLLSLSISNIVSLICLSMLIGLRFTLVTPYREVYCLHWYERFINLAMPYLTPINNMFQLSGIYLTTAVSIDRYVLIRKRVKESLDRKKRHKITRFIIFMIFLFSFLYTLPNWFLYKSVVYTIGPKELVSFNNSLKPFDLDQSALLFQQYDQNIKEHTSISLTNSTKFITTSTTTYTNFMTFSAKSTAEVPITYIRTVQTKFGQNPITKYVLHAYLYIPIVFAAPVCVLLIVNFLIIYKLIGITARKRQLGAITSIDRSITIMLVLIVLVFLVCQVPLMVAHIMSTVRPNIMFSDSFIIFTSFANFLLCINLSINFALYCFFGEAFRKTIQSMFCIRQYAPMNKHTPVSMLMQNHHHYQHHHHQQHNQRSVSIFSSIKHSFLGSKRMSIEMTNDKYNGKQQLLNAPVQLNEIKNGGNLLSANYSPDKSFQIKQITFDKHGMNNNINNNLLIKIDANDNTTINAFDATSNRHLVNSPDEDASNMCLNKCENKSINKSKERVKKSPKYHKYIPMVKFIPRFSEKK